MNIVSFSGGKDSTAMLFMMLERGIKVDRVICVDTTKEFPQMYEHIEKVQKLCPVKIEIVKIDFDYWFGERIKTKGHIGEIGYGWPNMLNRWCTALKRDAMKKLKTKDDITFIGIAFDEKERTLIKNVKENFRYPLVEWGITEKQALDYCYSKGFDWGGLYEKCHRVSCWCCPLSRIGALEVLYNDFPDLWKELIEMDKKSVKKFKANYSVKDLTNRFYQNQNLAF